MMRTDPCIAYDWAKALQALEISKIVGVIFDHGDNGIWLPGKAGGGAMKTVHAGKHEAYSDAMSLQMNKFLKASGMQLSNPNTWTKQALDEARGKIEQMQNRAGHALNEGRIMLIQRFEGQEIDKAELFEMWTKIFEDVP